MMGPARVTTYTCWPAVPLPPCFAMTGLTTAPRVEGQTRRVRNTLRARLEVVPEGETQRSTADLCTREGVGIQDWASARSPRGAWVGIWWSVFQEGEVGEFVDQEGKCCQRFDPLKS